MDKSSREAELDPRTRLVAGARVIDDVLARKAREWIADYDRWIKGGRRRSGGRHA